MDLYLTSASPECEEKLATLVGPCLSKEKRDRIARCRAVEQRVSMLLDEALLVWVLRERYGVEIALWERAREEHGKPYLRMPASTGDEPSLRCPVEFSMSHSHGYVLLGVDTARIGVDIQWHTDPSSSLARRVMPRVVYERFLEDSDRAGFFSDYWARRESELKRSGIGIAGLSLTDEPLPSGVMVCDLPAPPGFSAAVCGCMSDTTGLGISPVPVEHLL